MGEPGSRLTQRRRVRSMSLVDRWLSRSLPEERVATPATLRQDSSISADFSVATALRHDATLPIAPPALPPMSQPVATRLRHGNPQDAAVLAPLSQMSQLSQDVASAPCGNAKKERATIVEHDAGIPREWAEGCAQLIPDRPPSNVPVKRWQTFIVDIGRFFDGGWGEKAAAFGWGQLTCLAATAIGHMRGGSTKPACSGSSTATGWLRCPRRRRQ